MDDAPGISNEVDLNKSLQEVLKSAARNDGLARGLRGWKLDNYCFSSKNKSFLVFVI